MQGRVETGQTDLYQSRLGLRPNPHFSRRPGLLAIPAKSLSAAGQRCQQSQRQTLRFQQWLQRPRPTV